MRVILTALMVATMAACSGGGGGSAPSTYSTPTTGGSSGSTTTTATATRDVCYVTNNIDCHGHSTQNLKEYTKAFENEVVEIGVGFRVTNDSYKKSREDLQEIIDWINNRYVEDGVYIDLYIADVVYTNEEPTNKSNGLVGAKAYAKDARSRGKDVDIAIYMWNATRDNSTGGVANYPSHAFHEPGYVSVKSQRYISSNAKLIAHEIGHTMGLAHGPTNINNKSSGYIFNSFGHGFMVQDYDNCKKASTGSIMSYASHIVGHSGHDTPICDNVYTMHPLHPESNEVLALNLIRYEASRRMERF